MSEIKYKYLELAIRAGQEERRNDWLEAANLWLGASQRAYGLNLEWTQLRFDFCCIRYGIRPATFSSHYLQEKKTASPFVSQD
ncbi:ANR family transcriptional regulator [Vibrio sp. B172a]|uniref:ANR family transcriptional regulator n=1 Tax=Vibrio sp. B172a TaxID=2835790 RepID=UPI0025553A3B|nr:ANR family transcriptional regulator [Vibrio sp. B172a]MDK9785126.1 ANR family transcriptional regulator [Vibrio sp. B172a]